MDTMGGRHPFSELTAHFTPEQRQRIEGKKAEMRGVHMTVKNGMRPVHPGEVLRDELDELEMSPHALARALAVPPNRITAILKGQRGVTADTALRLSRYFGTTPEFWMNLQQTFELRTAEETSGAEVAATVQPRLP